MTLRTRLTLLTALLIIASTSVLGAVVYGLAGRIQMDAIDRDLYAEISEARVKSLQDNPRPPQDGIYVSVALGRVNRNGDGILQLRPAGTREEPIPVPPLTADQIAAATVAPITVGGAIDFRVAVRSHGPGLSTVVAAAPLTAYQASMSLLAQAIALGAIIVMVIGGLAAWVAVRGAFRPMTAVVASARRISAGEVDHRLPGGSTGTEIGDLSAAMNGMIDSLAAAVQRVQESEEQLRAFVSAASHEIRTPLTVIRGYAEILASRTGDRTPQEARALERIEAESRRLDELVTGLLILQRSTAKASSDRDLIPVASLVRESFEDLQALEPDRPITVTVTASAEASLVAGDAEGLRQLFANIVQNIQRHTPPATAVSIQLTTEPDPASPEDGWVRIVVDDAGPGLPPNDRAPQAELPGVTSPARAARGSGGFGLGMSIMSAVVQFHGGTMLQGTSPAGGLRLDIRLPLHAASDVHQASSNA